MPSINLIKTSDGTGNAAVATVQSSRFPLATTIIVDTVDNFPSTFMGSMGTPHTFVDPITAEEITVISDATAVDFTGHVDGTNLEIDSIDPGYTDLGSSAGDIVVIRPTSEYGNNIASVLEVSHNDDGSLKNSAIPGALDGWMTGVLPAVSTVTANGNRSYTLGFSSSVASILSPGMRLQTTRTVPAPTTCFSLNGTNQYFSKTSPAGMTFTDDFVVSAWVKLTSYSGSIQAIASRTDGSSGWILYVDTTGQVLLAGYSGGSLVNNSKVVSYQSVPLNKWVHITAQLDMSSFTATTTTSYIMFDGVDVPCSVTRAGTNPTAFVQAGSLNVGSYNGGTSPFTGKISQVAIFNAKVTQATMRGYISQGLTGTETSLISAYSGANLTDLNTTNANNLTANNSATSGYASSPFGNNGVSSTLDYALVMSVSGSSVTVQVPEGCTIPTTGGVSAVSYSAHDSPFGFPRHEDRWVLEHKIRYNVTIYTVAQNTWYNIANQSLKVPTGDWELSISNYAEAVFSVSTYNALFCSVSTSAATAPDGTLDGLRFKSFGSQSANTGGYAINRSDYCTVELPLKTFYCNYMTDQTTCTAMTIQGTTTPSIITALPTGL